MTALTIAWVTSWKMERDCVHCRTEKNVMTLCLRTVNCVEWFVPITPMMIPIKSDRFKKIQTYVAKNHASRITQSSRFSKWNVNRLIVETPMMDGFNLQHIESYKNCWCKNNCNQNEMIPILVPLLCTNFNKKAFEWWIIFMALKNMNSASICTFNPISLFLYMGFRTARRVITYAQ